jgi:hypothetical protein
MINIVLFLVQEKSFRSLQIQKEYLIIWRSESREHILMKGEGERTQGRKNTGDMYGEVSHKKRHRDSDRIPVPACQQLSSDDLRSQAVSRPVPSAQRGLTTVVGMETGGSPAHLSLDKTLLSELNTISQRRSGSRATWRLRRSTATPHTSMRNQVTLGRLGWVGSTAHAASTSHLST